MTVLTDPGVQPAFTGVFRAVLPEIILVGTACLAFLAGPFAPRRWLWFVASILGLTAAMVVAGVVRVPMPDVPTAAAILPDGAAGFVRWVALIAAAVFVFVSWAEVKHSNAAEYYGCLLVAAAGVSLTGRANDLITLFLALELISIPTYILLYLPAQGRLSQEAAVKYFLLSVMSSAVLLFGFSYLYGLTGTTNLTAIVDSLTKAHQGGVPHSPLALVAVVLVVAAIGFRVTAVPFHFYAPDVYEGAPAGVVAQLAFLPKVAGFAALARLLGLVGADPRHLPFEAATQVPLLLWIIAVVTMTVGNVLALLQDNVRRMLAYSGVAHGGYMLIGLVVASSLPEAKGAPLTGGVEALLVYLAAYGAMTVGAFAVVLYLSTPERPVDAIDDLAGAGQSHPLSAGAMAVFLLSLIGLPLTAGFAGKLMLFVGAFTAPSDTPTMRNLYVLLAVIAAVNSAIAAVYYLRGLGVMYLRTPLRPAPRPRAVPTFMAVVALAGFTLVFGVWPEPLVKAARNAAPVPAAARADAGR